MPGKPESRNLGRSHKKKLNSVEDRTVSKEQEIFFIFFEMQKIFSLLR